MSANTSFWAAQLAFPSAVVNSYTGIQTDGNIPGQSNPGKNARFSLGGPQFEQHDPTPETYMMLNPNECFLGFDDDGMLTSPGVTCAISYNWSLNINRRMFLQAAVSNNQSNCPTDTWSGSTAACVVYFGYAAQASNPSGTATFIAAWSVDPTVYGDIAQTHYFLEDFNNQYAPGGYQCTNHPRGEWTYPTYKIAGSYYTSPGIYALDITNPNPPYNVTSCGLSYMTSFTTTNIRLRS